MIDPAAPIAGALGIDPAEVTDLVLTCIRRDRTVATAESLTAGLLCAVLTEVPGSSAVVLGGLVCYATELKQSLARVDAELLARVGPVHPEVAAQLAAGARAATGADIGLGLTGVAGPDRQNGHAPGTVYVALAGPGGLRIGSLAPDAGGPSSAGAPLRAQVRARSVRLALDLLRAALDADN